MTSSTLLMTYLHDVLRERRMTADELTYELDFPDNSVVEAWLKGWAKPRPGQLPKLAAALWVDPVDLAVGWLADAVPELEPALSEHVLLPRGSAFPKGTDLTLRKCAPRSPIESERLDVGDPHDREPRRSPAIKGVPERVVRKRPASSRAR